MRSGSPKPAAAVMRGTIWIAMVVCVSSLYEDQVGKNDFHMANIGDIKTAQFHPDTQRKRLYFSTSANILGALDSRSGNVLWRHSLATESVDAIATEGRHMASVTGGGKYLRVWTAAEGYLLWDTPTGATHASETADVKFVDDVDGDDHEDIAVASGDSVALFSGAKGKRLWRWQSDDSKLMLKAILHADGKAGSLKVAGAKNAGSGTVIDTVVDISLKLGTSKKGAKALGRSCPSIAILAHSVACVDAASKTLYTWTLNDLSQSSHSLDLLSPGVAVGNKARLDAAVGKDVLLVHMSADACVAVRVTKEGVHAQHTFAGTAAGRFVMAVGADKNGDEAIVQIAPAVGGGLELTMLSLKSKSMLKETYPKAAWSSEEQGQLARLWAQPYVRKEGSVGVRTLLKSESLKLTFLQQDKVLWQRNEALAYVQHAVLVDIPLPAPSHNELMDGERIGAMNPIARLVKRTLTDAADLLALVTTPPKVTSTPTQAQWDPIGVSLKHDLEPDRFGFKKVIVVTTAPGLVAGIHSGTGEVVWQRHYAEAVLERIFLTHGSAADGSLECVVIGRSTAGGEETSLVLYLQPLTGVELREAQVLPCKLVQVASAPLLMKSHAQVVVAMDSKQRVHVMPDTREARQLVAAKSGKIFFYVTHVGSSEMKGYGVATTADGGLVAEEAWNVALPKSEAITGLAPHNVQEAIRSAGRVLGNRAVLLKYINVNSLAVATESVGGQVDSKEVSSAPTVGAKEPCVRIYIVDTVTGAILHSVVHRDAKGPVHLVQTENTVVYNYWNNKKQRYEVSVMELYENSKSEILTAGQMMMYNDSKTTYSSHGMQTEKPRVLTQTYIMPVGVKNMDVTQCVHGITTRNILVALANDKVLSLDRKFLDPRRPVGKPSPDDVEEMLVPYSPFVPIIPTSILSYNHTVYQLRGFAVAPARIESTSLMLAYGVDLFFTRVAPAKAFDCLGEDFNYASLVASTLGLGTLSWLANWYAAKSELEKAWK